MGRRVALTAVVVATLLWLGSGIAAAADRMPSQSGKWTEDATWNNNPPPGPADSVTIPAGVAIDFDVPRGDLTFASLKVASLTVEGKLQTTKELYEIEVAGDVTVVEGGEIANAVRITAEGSLRVDEGGHVRTDSDEGISLIGRDVTIAGEVAERPGAGGKAGQPGRRTRIEATDGDVTVTGRVKGTKGGPGTEDDPSGADGGDVELIGKRVFTEDGTVEGGDGGPGAGSADDGAPGKVEPKPTEPKIGAGPGGDGEMPRTGGPLAAMAALGGLAIAGGWLLIRLATRSRSA